MAEDQRLVGLVKTLDAVLEVVARRLPPTDLLRLVEELRALPGRAPYRASIERLAEIAQRRYNPGG